MTTILKIKQAIKQPLETLSNNQSFMRCMSAAVFISMYAMQTLAQSSKGETGFLDAANEISLYQDPVRKLMYAIAAVIAIVGAFNIYFKMQNGDQDVKKTIMMTIGGCVAFVAAASALPKFFQ